MFSNLNVCFVIGFLLRPTVQPYTLLVGVVFLLASPFPWREAVRNLTLLSLIDKTLIEPESIMVPKIEAHDSIQSSLRAKNTYCSTSKTSKCQANSKFKFLMQFCIRNLLKIHDLAVVMISLYMGEFEHSNFSKEVLKKFQNHNIASFSPQPYSRPPDGLFSLENAQ